MGDYLSYSPDNNITMCVHNNLDMGIHLCFTCFFSPGSILPLRGPELQSIFNSLPPPRPGTSTTVTAPSTTATAHFTTDTESFDARHDGSQCQKRAPHPLIRPTLGSIGPIWLGCPTTQSCPIGPVTPPVQTMAIIFRLDLEDDHLLTLTIPPIDTSTRSGSSGTASLRFLGGDLSSRSL